MKELVSRQLLEVVFGTNIPKFFLEKLQLQRIEELLTEFKFVVVLPLGKPRKNRITWSSLDEEEYWMQVISGLLPTEKKELLNDFPKDCRKVLDFDGSWGEIFLDDLHQDGETLQMCRIFDLQGDEIARIRKIESPLREKLPSSILFHPCFLACLSVGGMWGIRESLEGRFLSVLWVSEAKWKGNIKQVQKLVDDQNSPKEWGVLKSLSSKQGMDVYPDGIEFFENGRIDLSLAFIAKNED